METRTIECTTGEAVLVDAQDYEWAIQWRWRCVRGYAARRVRMDGRRKWLKMHREILKRMGHADFPQCDHVDRDKLNNTRVNLRVATHQQNNQNHGRLRNNTSGYIGVCWAKGINKWQAYIKLDGRSRTLGRFDDLLYAVKTYDIAAIHCRDSDFVVLNLPRSHYPSGPPSSWPTDSFSAPPALKRLMHFN